jgi:predicted alpha-1,6-mannanase (GH76 family)
VRSGIRSTHRGPHKSLPRHPNPSLSTTFRQAMVSRRPPIYRGTLQIVFLVSTLASLIILGSAFQQLNSFAVSNYRAYSDASMTALQRMYNMSTGQWMHALWWQQANALETTIDYSLQTHTNTYTTDIAITFNHNKYHNFLNDYYDDEGWWAVTWIKAYDLTHRIDYLDMSKRIFRDMTNGWDATCNGGLWWNKDKTNKNAITNELFLQVAVRLHQHTPGDTLDSGNGPQHISYIGWAMKEWQWFKNSGMINSSNLVNDGLDSSTCQNNGETTWTYNQGVILGGLTDLYKVTHNPSYLTQAEAIANANDKTNVDTHGVLYEQGCESDDSCGDDAPQFKGIYIKNLYYLYQTDHKRVYRNFIIKNADAIWAHDRDDNNDLGLHWDGPFDSVQARRQSPAIDALNAAIYLNSYKLPFQTWNDNSLAYGLPAQRKQFLELVR